MSEFSGSVLIDCPVAEVWSFISNPQSASLWGRGVSDVVVTSGGPVGLGSTITLRMSGSDMGARMIKYEALHTFTLEFTSGPVHGSKLTLGIDCPLR